MILKRIINTVPLIHRNNAKFYVYLRDHNKHINP